MKIRWPWTKPSNYAALPEHSFFAQQRDPNQQTPDPMYHHEEEQPVVDVSETFVDTTPKTAPAPAPANMDDLMKSARGSRE